jgi:hypothetical protein
MVLFLQARGSDVGKETKTNTGVLHYVQDDDIKERWMTTSRME